jgi:general secretion pathway protein A
MYNDFFRFHQSPFSIAPDPGFLYLSQRHREALAHLMYGLKTDGGFVLVTGEVGTGKTTLLRSVVAQAPEELDIAFILNPRLTVRELLETLCDELRLTLRADHAQSVKYYIDRLNQHLLHSHARGRNTVVVIDEAQNLPPTVLEQIRLLTNLETDNRKLLRIILVGQPELDTLLERPDMRQLAQRITARCHLTALDRRETRAYVAHRLTLAGGHSDIFTSAALNELFRLSGGVPRLINVIADRALLGAYVENTPRITPRILRNAAHEVGGQTRAPMRWLAGAAVAVLLAVGAWAWFDSGANFATWAARGEGSATVDLAAAGDDTDDAPVADAAPLPITPPEPFLIISPDAEIRFTDDWPDDEDALGPARFQGEGRIIRPGATVDRTPTEPSEVAAPVAPTTAVEGPPTAETTAVDLIPRPPGVSTYRSLLLAFEALFVHWDRRFDDSDVPCNVAPGVGLQCLRRHGGWEELTRLNHPAVLEFRDSDDEPYFAALTRYDQDDVELHFGRTTVRLSIGDLAASWPGSFVVLWEMPPGYRGSVALGDDQPAVAWLRRQLAQLLSISLDSPRPSRFDDAMDQALREFQRRNGLVDDGIAGPATWIHISGQVADVPLLDTRTYGLSGHDARSSRAEM